MTSSFEAGGAGGFGSARWSGGRPCGMRWKPLEIAAVVVAFLFWWPVGVALVGLKLAQRRGYRWDEAVASMRSAFAGFSPRATAGPAWRPFAQPGTGNAAFDEWRTAELAKLDEERRKLDAAHREFAEHLDNLRRARDREEFDRFMRDRATRQG